ncbi:DUF4031 domain-containing protein [Nostocoides sp. HKS02]|uniref:DUF4031 domain-containing protein n=1 Tax=Nostocoides sp. HKS02 TaxID=1813880 RepID=UPI0012B476E6|nr:DUF4031 domain-containing protein [Tetrasphaera sp. HKS02]QGN59001.1 DUF4031 domain-containing protein [Tetrasphaera sp. HKS02]
MTIWIDPPAWPAHGRLWSHLISDESYAELHDFAAAQGIPPRGFEGDHYDVPEERHAALVAAGARSVGGRELARILRDSGLRIQKRTRERVIRSVPDAPWLPPGSRVDVIASRHEAVPANTVVVRLALVRGENLLAVAGPDGGLDLPSRPVGDTGAADAVEELRHSILGASRDAAPQLLGYVRNTVPKAGPEYPWPTPQACFAVFVERDVLEEAVDGRWLDADGARAALSGRHWWPLLLDGDHR